MRRDWWRKRRVVELYENFYAKSSFIKRARYKRTGTSISLWFCSPIKLLFVKRLATVLFMFFVVESLATSKKDDRSSPTKQAIAQSQSIPQQVTINNQTIFRAEKILKSRKWKGKRQCLVKWFGYPTNQSRWEPEKKHFGQTFNHRLWRIFLLTSDIFSNMFPFHVPRNSSLLLLGRAWR